MEFTTQQGKYDVNKSDTEGRGYITSVGSSAKTGRSLKEESSEYLTSGYGVWESSMKPPLKRLAAPATRLSLNNLCDFYRF